MYCNVRFGFALEVDDAGSEYSRLGLERVVQLFTRNGCFGRGQRVLAQNVNQGLIFGA